MDHSTDNEVAEHSATNQPQQMHNLGGQPHVRHNSLDPTGMFRNRGRRAVLIRNAQSSPPVSPTKESSAMNQSSVPPTNVTQNNNMNSLRTRYEQLVTTPSHHTVSDETTMQSVSNTPYSLQHIPQIDKQLKQHQKIKPQNHNHSMIVNLSSPMQNIDGNNNAAKEEEPEKYHPQPQDNSKEEDEEEVHSTIGSTVSVMGSVVSANNETDEKLLAVKMRMMQDVAEDVEEGEGEEEENDDENDANVMDISMECNVDDTDDVNQSSLLQDEPIKQNESKVVKVADFSDKANNYESPLRAAFRTNTESLKQRFNEQTVSSSTIIDKATTTASLLARQCFSFEDTTVDDNNFLIMPDELHKNIGIADGGSSHLAAAATQHKYYGLSAVASFTAASEHEEETTKVNVSHQAKEGSQFTAKTPRWYPPNRTTLSNNSRSKGSPFRVIRQSKTWNVEDGQQSSAYKNRRDGVVDQTFSFDPWSPRQVQTGFGDTNIEVKDWKKTESELLVAIDLLSGIADELSNMNEVECDDICCDKCRGDSGVRSSCKDCLERVTCITNNLKDLSANSCDGDQSSTFDHQTRSKAIDMLLGSHEYALKSRQSSLAANKWLSSIGRIAGDNNGDIKQPINDDSDLRPRLLSAENALVEKQEEISRLKTEIGRLSSSSRTQQPSRSTNNKSVLSESSSSDSIDNEVDGESLDLCSPRHIKPCESQDDSFILWEQNIESQMNLESRKEILLLRAALEKANRTIDILEKKKDPFTSDIEPIADASADKSEEAELFIRIADNIENEGADTPVSNDADNDDKDAGNAIRLDDPVLEKELEEFKDALLATVDESRRARHSREDSITSSDDEALAKDLSKSNSSDNRKVSVRMLDGENFSTEWNESLELPPPPDHSLHSPIVYSILTSWTDDEATRLALVEWIENILNGSNAGSMPSLKLSGLDHQIRDGFIMHILPLLLRRKDVHVHLTSRIHRQTTYDIAVRISPNVAPVQNEYDGDPNVDSEDTPADDVQQRTVSRDNKHHLIAYKATTSGAAINESQDEQKSPIKQTSSLFSPPFLSNLVRTSSNTGSISGASAITSPISNRTPRYSKSRYTSLSSEMNNNNTSFTQDKYATPSLMGIGSPSLVDDLSVASSVEEDDDEDEDDNEDDDADSRQSEKQSSIMGSISGAFGLLSRQHKPSPEENVAPSNSQPSTFQTSYRESNLHMSNDRVVSAPPGKIGITFMDYRGFAMVSNVARNSPLAGWVFESDVLIAIDDVPVSGLRTRDIVKLLTNRAGQQRNLRMVSAVALSELTRPGTV